MATGNGILAALHLWELDPPPKERYFDDFSKAKSCFLSCCIFPWERETGAPTNVAAARSHHLPPGFGGTVFKGGSSKMLNDQVTSISSLPNHLNYEPPKAQGLLLQLLLCSIGRHRWCRWRHGRFGPFALLHLPVLAIRCRRLSWEDPLLGFPRYHCHHHHHHP